MRNIIILLFIVLLTSCEKKSCYTCTLYREDNNSGSISIDSSIVVEKCNTTEKEIKQYEKDNYYYKEKPFNSYYKKTMTCIK